MRFGEFQLDIASDGRFRLDGGAMFGVVPKVLWEKQFPADEKNRIELATNCLLIRTPFATILVETGNGNQWIDKLREMYAIRHDESLLDSLAKLGVQPEAIDFVVNSHLHFDHAGGNTLPIDGTPRPAFPKAKYVWQRIEFEHAMAPHDRDRASYFPDNFVPVFEAGQALLVDGETEFTPGVAVVPMPGHNRGMQCVRIRSGESIAWFWADLMPTTAHLPPPWVMAYDLYPIEAMDQKRAATCRAIAENWLCIFYHDPRVPMGHIVEDGGKLRLVPVAD